MYLWVRSISILPLSTIFLLYFRIILTVWYFRIILTVWYFRIITTVWYFRIILTVWYFRIILTVWYFRIILTVWYLFHLIIHLFLWMVTYKLHMQHQVRFHSQKYSYWYIYIILTNVKGNKNIYVILDSFTPLFVTSKQNKLIHNTYIILFVDLYLYITVLNAKVQ
jgi:hypothetical protein